MVKKRIKLSEINDTLVLYYGCEETKIDSETFINSLIGLREILEATNDYFNPTQTITINIEAIAPGSFKAKISHKNNYLTELFKSAEKELKSSPITTTGTTLSLLVALLALNGSKPQIINHYNIVINNDIAEFHSNNSILEIDADAYKNCSDFFEQSDKVKKGINKHFTALVKDAAITSFQLLSHIDDGDVLYESTSKQFKALIISDKEEKKEIEEKVTLTIYAPVLADAKRKWEFTWNWNHISAYINDPDFFEKMKARAIGFKQGDVIDVTLKRKQKLDLRHNTYIDDSYEVVKVLSEPRAVTSTQMTLQSINNQEDV
jgi:hypothetical protein